VPAFNTAAYIAEALESVLAQIGGDDEVIVVDDGSTDDTAAVASRYPVRVIRAPHRGIGATINAAMREARGELIASIDADDRWLPGKMQRQLAVLDADPSIDAVFGHLRQFLSPEADRDRFDFRTDAIPGLGRGTMVIRREAWARAGEMEVHLSAGEFVSWYARAIDAGLNMHMLPDVVYERRVHGRNTVIRERETANLDYVRLVKATLDRRRAAARERAG
jgi:glycosyltransferase involved in cell wall biosynthesis